MEASHAEMSTLVEQETKMSHVQLSDAAGAAVAVMEAISRDLREVTSLVLQRSSVEPENERVALVLMKR